ncbi:GNAT family N-acetyltransferase [Oceanibacterium hippocampi]|uniref:N-acetyltransferase domain-containing protein n=1 Tax=Oceanibacterium hippocampi TaxID=745714 RepID=A0A1Y5SN38_9PROT|nr:GNAT family N-acetyltransferase [Oceanibacterium hippocampi]SLN43376.1 hypothetical protein OCH7691_01803 [Oceanibacterium hippocampi]
MRFIVDGSVRTAEQAFRAIDLFEREWETSGFGLFAVERKDIGGLIGFTGFARPDFLPEVLPAVEIGWRFARAQWGSGFATEAATAALAFGTETLRLDGIVSICQVGNDASARIMRKLGLVFDRRTVDPGCGRAVLVWRLPR